MKSAKKKEDLKKVIQDKKALRRAVMLSMLLENPYTQVSITKDRRADLTLPSNKEGNA